MDIVQQLGTALSLAALSGVNLYLTVFVAGLAIRLHWILLAPQYAQFHVLADPIILGIAGVLFALQFLADKIPWVDSFWDALQTFIRPLGGACLAVLAMGNSHPVFNVAAAFIGGAVALTSHTAKSGTRLFVNTSPEPFSNIFLSLAEDVGVIGTLILVYLKPVIAFGLSLVFLLTLVILMPRILAQIRIILWLAASKLNAPAWKPEGRLLPSRIPSAVHRQVARLCTEPSDIAWALPCASASSSTFPPHVRGWLIALTSPTAPLYFLGKKGWSWLSLLIPVERLLVRVEHRFLSDRLLLSSQDRGNTRHIFVFSRPFLEEVRLAEQDIDRRAEAYSLPSSLNPSASENVP